MKGWRTIAFNGAVLALALIDLFIDDGQVLAVVFHDPARSAAALAALKVANIVLRFFTTTPVFDNGRRSAEQADAAAP